MTVTVVYHAILHASSRCCAVPRFYTAPISVSPLALAESCAVPRGLARFIAENIRYYVVKG
jgi:hypothetical protein